MWDLLIIVQNYIKMKLINNTVDIVGLRMVVGWAFCFNFPIIPSPNTTSGTTPNQTPLQRVNVASKSYPF